MLPGVQAQEQGAVVQKPAAGAAGAGSLGMCQGGDESALPHSLQKTLIFFGLNCITAR